MVRHNGIVKVLDFGLAKGYQGEAAVREVLSAQQLNPNVGHGELAYLYLHPRTRSPGRA